MSHTGFQSRLVKKIKDLTNISNAQIETPPQGMSSKVFFIKRANGEEYAVKYGKDAIRDVPALELIAKSKIDIPIPHLYKHFVFEETPVIILERIKYPLLESVTSTEMGKYIPAMIESLNSIHSIKSSKSGTLTELPKTRPWKEMLLSTFTGEDFDWNEIANRKGLDRELVLESVKKITDTIKKTEFAFSDYSLLHTDFNQRNLFVNTSTYKVTGIIDWEDVMYGDPVFDFARIRMLIWHFDLGDEAIRMYYEMMNYSDRQLKLEDLYWLYRVIQYLAWYSEELNDFNVGRIKLHQGLLRNYLWE